MLSHRWGSVQFKKSTENRDKLLNQAISHAKHAVQVERHPLPLTTLGKILVEEMKYNKPRFEKAFEEAFDYLEEAVNLEGRMNRIAIHPYMTLFSGVRFYLNNGGKLNRRQREHGKTLIDTADRLFAKDEAVQIQLANIRSSFS